MPSIIPFIDRDDGGQALDLKDVVEAEAQAAPPAVLTDSEVAHVASLKADGNAHFKAGRLEEALHEWSECIKLYEGRSGDGEQRLVKATICSNMAEALLKLERAPEALSLATAAVGLDGSNKKARFRRARALIDVGGSPELSAAVVELRTLKETAEGEGAPVSREVAELTRSLRSLQANLRDKSRANASGLRAAFASGGGLGGGETAPSADAAAAPAAAEAADFWVALVTRHAHPMVDENCGCFCPLHYSWFIDAYRTHVDDNRHDVSPFKTVPAHGLGEIGHSAAGIALDFLVFCKLAVANGVINKLAVTLGVMRRDEEEGELEVTPSLARQKWRDEVGAEVQGKDARAHKRSADRMWDWDLVLGQALPMLQKGFHPIGCHAPARYGAAAGEASAFRRAASLVYAPVEAAAEMKASLSKACWADGAGEAPGGKGASKYKQASSRGEFYFQDEETPKTAFKEVGGVEVWLSLLAKLHGEMRARDPDVPIRAVEE